MSHFSAQNLIRYHLFFSCNLNLLLSMTLSRLSQIDWIAITLKIAATGYDIIKHPTRSWKRDLERRLRRCVRNRDSVMEMTRLFRHHWARQTLFCLLTDKVQCGQRQSWWCSDATLKTAAPLITNFERFSVSVWGKLTHCERSVWLQRA